MREIYILCAWWSRPAITRLHVWSVNRFILSAPSNYRIKYVAVISPEDPHREELLEIASGLDVVMASNEYLGAKHNAGVKHILRRIHKGGYLMNIGSDDLIDPAYWDQIDALWGKDMFGMSSLYITDEAQTYILRVNCYMIGAGRFLLADKIRHIRNFLHLELYEEEKQRGLDGSSAGRMAMAGAEYSTLDDDHAYILDIKTATNINKMSTFSRLKTTLPADRKEIAHFYPDDYQIPSGAHKALQKIPSSKPIHTGMRVNVYADGHIYTVTIGKIDWEKQIITARCNFSHLNGLMFNFKELFE